MELYNDIIITVSLQNQVTGWPRTLENRENGEKKIPAGKNQGIWNFAENQG